MCVEYVEYGKDILLLYRVTFVKESMICCQEYISIVS